jgi:hypothetical protein
MLPGVEVDRLRRAGRGELECAVRRDTVVLGCKRRSDKNPQETETENRTQAEAP